MNSEKSIIIVDDEESILDFVKYNLTKEGYEVVTFDNAESAIIYFEAHNRVSLIISDWLLPEKSGIDLLEMVKNDNRLYNIPFIMMTIKNSNADINLALRKGVNDYLVKPFKLADLKERVHKYLV